MSRPKKTRRGRGEGAVFYSESKGWWIGRAIVGVKPNGKPLYREVTAKTKGAALTKKQKAEEAARSGALTDTDRMTLGQFLDHWLTNVSKPSVAITTWESYERCARLHLKPKIGGVRMAQLRPAHVEALFAELQRDGMTGGNAKKVSQVLSTALEHAGRTDLVVRNPAASIPKPRAPEVEIIPFMPPEIARIRKAAAGHRLEALFALAICTGARQGELLGLNWANLDLGNAVINISRSLAMANNAFFLKELKSKRGRRKVEIPGFAVTALRNHQKRMLAEGNHKAPVVFCTKTGHFISKSSFVRHMYKPLLEQAGVPYRKFHTFRHTHPSELLSRGESVVGAADRRSAGSGSQHQCPLHPRRRQEDRRTPRRDVRLSFRRRPRVSFRQGGVKVEFGGVTRSAVVLRVTQVNEKTILATNDDR